MKRLTKEQWKALNIYNAHDICKRGKGRVFVGYMPQVTGRFCRAAKWQVIQPGFQTDINAHWTDYGNKTFTVYSREEKEAKRLEAIAWASFVYKIEGEWERDPWGDWHPAGTLEAAAKSKELQHA